MTNMSNRGNMSLEGHCDFLACRRPACRQACLRPTHVAGTALACPEQIGTDLRRPCIRLYLTGTVIGAPTGFTMTTRIFAGAVLLALRETE